MMVSQATWLACAGAGNETQDLGLPVLHCSARRGTEHDTDAVENMGTDEPLEIQGSQPRPALRPSREVLNGRSLANPSTRSQGI